MAVRYNSKEVEITVNYKDGSTRRTTEYISPRTTLNALFSRLLLTYTDDFINATEVIMKRDGKLKTFVI